MNRILSILLMVLLVTSLAACSNGNKKDTSSGESKEKKSDVTLTILLSDDMLEGGGFHELAKMYKEETGINVEIIEVPYADLPSKLNNMIRAGNAPAIVRGTEISQFSSHILSLEDTISRDVILDARLDACLLDDELKALPSNVTANGMLYNKTAFEQAGVDVPTGDGDVWTWDEFVVAVEKVVNNSDVDYGLVWDHSQHRYSTLLYQFGGSLFNKDLTATTIANEKSQSALEFFVSLFDKNIIPKSSWVGTEDPSAMFKTGKVAVHMSGNWKVADYTENIDDFEWGAVVMPYQENRSSVLGGNFVFAIDGSGVEAEAKEFLSWFYSKEVYTKYCEIGQYLPAQKEITPKYESDTLEVFAKELESTPSIAGTDWIISNKYPGLSWGNALRDNIDLVIVGDITVEEALGNAEEVILDTYTDLTAER